MREICCSPRTTLKRSLPRIPANQRIWRAILISSMSFGSPEEKELRKGSTLSHFNSNNAPPSQIDSSRFPHGCYQLLGPHAIFPDLSVYPLAIEEKSLRSREKKTQRQSPDFLSKFNGLHPIITKNGGLTVGRC